VKELKGFQKISLKPGETRDVSFVLSADDLKYYNHELQYVCEPGDFEIMVGPNSNELQSVKLKVR
jgi:beta-glucosidase